MTYLGKSRIVLKASDIYLIRIKESSFIYKDVIK